MKGSGTWHAGQHRDFLDRVRRYISLRKDGVTSYEAAMQVGIDPFRTRSKYERWYKAGIVPGQAGSRKAGT